MRRVSPCLIVALLAVACFSLAAILQPRAAWHNRDTSGSVLKLLLGDSRRMFANHFFVKADVSFHSGFYPSIFDQRKGPKESPMAGGRDVHDDNEHAKEMAFLGEPRDWIDRFGRHFRLSKDTHLANGQEREILPWLKLSAELDPQRVETYTVAAFWLRVRLGNAKAAEEFLREGLRNNPNNCQILFELGRVYYDGNHDAGRARNVWDLALRKWNDQESSKQDPDFSLRTQIAENLAELEEKEGNFDRAIGLLELAKKGSPHPADLEAQIAELKAKRASRPMPP